MAWPSEEAEISANAELCAGALTRSPIDYLETRDEKSAVPGASGRRASTAAVFAPLPTPALRLMLPLQSREDVTERLVRRNQSSCLARV